MRELDPEIFGNDKFSNISLSKDDFSSNMINEDKCDILPSSCFKKVKKLIRKMRRSSNISVQMKSK
jgi:hypothetical protein